MPEFYLWIIIILTTFSNKYLMNALQRCYGRAFMIYFIYFIYNLFFL